LFVPDINGDTGDENEIQLSSNKYNDKNERLYTLDNLIRNLEKENQQGRGKEFIKLLSNRINEVQYET